MPVMEYTRSLGKHYTYRIEYDRQEYYIERGGEMKKSVPDAVVAGVLPGEATPELMRRMAVADIEALIGMDE